MKTLTDRKITEEGQKTYNTQRMAQEQRQGVEKETVKASQSVEIVQRTVDATVKKVEGDASLKLNLNAEAEAERISKTGLAEAERIKAIGQSTAEAYQLQVSAMGGDNFTKYKITEEIGKGKIKVIPDVLISGNSGSDGGISGLLGMKLMKMMDAKKEITKTK